MIESPCRCSYKGGYLVVRKEDDTVTVHLSEISSIMLANNQVFLSAYLLSELAKCKISVVITDEKHNPIGQYLPLYGSHNASKRIQEQLSWGEPIKKRVWQHVVKEKIRQQASVLYDYGFEIESKRLFDSVAEVRSGDTTNREAFAARLYFETLFGKGFTREDDAPINAGLNYGYAVLLSLVNREIVSRGYMTQSGIFHRNEFNQFNLACDLMEPFRPFVDRLVLDSIGLDFDSNAKRSLADIANKSVAYKEGQYRLGSVLSLFVQDCLNALNKAIAVDDIESFDAL